jgi:hypothetical protein
MGNRGPEPLPLEEKRVHRFHVHVNELELDRLERVIGAPGLADLVRTRNSRRNGMRLVADLMRAKLLAHRAPTRVVVPELNQRLVADLGRAAENVNQLAHHLNQATLTGSASADAAAILAEIADLRDALEDALLGISEASTPRTSLTARPNDVDGIDSTLEF